ncbi:hypothetical protein LTR62_008306 [Meristemomyces frigidus]|uniref:2-(3-amino-3-carboxypropyl)histidine synthase subunit 2 n=1 Tax=Meristemomyces frigidus TaxID=1508187 RepID=A0AAN7TAR4_9PEZI|nr:hypothetical protein LTR62_008306 [Meristemomyces frigidus]
MAEYGPTLSTPAERTFEDSIPVVADPQLRMSHEQLYLQYEIKRTVREIREGQWRRIALQFPDEMLVDAPRVYEKLQSGLKTERLLSRQNSKLRTIGVDDSVPNGAITTQLTTNGKADHEQTDDPERLTILADTSYGACCVDEVAAEHVDADVVVHYGRSCLSPTARLPVIYIFTSRPLDLEEALVSFRQTYPSKDAKVCLVADIPYNHHLAALAQRFREEGYSNVFATEIRHDPASLIPNRSIPPEAQADPEKLREYSVFHISTPPSSLLLILTSRVGSIYILPTDTNLGTSSEAATMPLLRRRYGLVTRLATAAIFGILINTLSVKNYMTALQHCQDLIRKAGKKSYVFVVGKVNAAKIANFSEIDGWVVIGCWESSLIESKEFYRPIITPFELEIALQSDETRGWGSEWVGDFGTLLGRSSNIGDGAAQKTSELAGTDGDKHTAADNYDDHPSDDEPPEFDLRTGRYVSHTRPMGRANPNPTLPNHSDDGTSSYTAPPSSALVQRAKGDLATVNGAVSPAAEFLRSKRTWQGLGSDFEIAYERDDEGQIRGAAVEEGRCGVARGYAVGGDEART